MTSEIVILTTNNNPPPLPWHYIIHMVHTHILIRTLICSRSQSIVQATYRVHTEDASIKDMYTASPYLRREVNGFLLKI